MEFVSYGQYLNAFGENEKTINRKPVSRFLQFKNQKYRVYQHPIVLVAVFLI
jgi:hypothetical protein